MLAYSKVIFCAQAGLWNYARIEFIAIDHSAIYKQRLNATTNLEHNKDHHHRQVVLSDDACTGRCNSLGMPSCSGPVNNKDRALNISLYYNDSPQILNRKLKPDSYFLRELMRHDFDDTGLFSMRMFHRSSAQVNWCELFVTNLWRKNLYRICICSKYEPGFTFSFSS